MAKTSRAAELEPIDRLEEKIKRLIGLVDRLRTEHARAADENERLTQELETFRARLADAERADTEVTTLRAEREQIRTRVTDMLERLDAIDL